MKQPVIFPAILFCSITPASAQDSTGTYPQIGKHIYSIKPHLGIGKYHKDFSHGRFPADITVASDPPLSEHFGVQTPWQLLPYCP